MQTAEPLELLLPGNWQLSFTEHVSDDTGAGAYLFKLAGTVSADVRDVYNGQAHWYGYWQVIEARLLLDLREVSARCNSCLGSGAVRAWQVELEQVGTTRFSGTLYRDENDTQTVVFERVD